METVGSKGVVVMAGKSKKRENILISEIWTKQLGIFVSVTNRIQ
jgi:hypothetical protein